MILRMLSDNTDTAQKHCSHTEEAHLARSKQITYKEALTTIYDRRHALSNALPFSARVLGHGDSFLFRQGVLCVLAEGTVQVTEVHSTYNPIRLDFSNILHNISPAEVSIELMNYSDHVLAVRIGKTSRSNYSRIYAISTDRNKPDSERILGMVELQEYSKTFVRHTARYLYYGTHTGWGNDGHHKWEIRGVSLDDRYPLPQCARLLLEDFHGTDIGSTVAFEIYNDQFHAVSNQGTYEVEEVDWTSFYHCVRFPIDSPVPAALERDARVYRRQHAEGPIHDSWTDLTLQLDERTNETIIVESRREWLQASSRQSRTFYTSLFQASPVPPPSSSSQADPTRGSILPEDDLFVALLDSSNNPNYMHTPPQYSCNRHPEFSKDATAQRSFILARTKFRAYNYSASTFLDLVEDEQCCNNITAPCLRLRIGSRRIAPSSPDTRATSMALAKSPQNPTTAFEDSTQYRHPPVRMWPPPHTACPCAARLHSILNPSLAPGPRRVTGILDERCLVYMVQPGRGHGSRAGKGTVVCVDFSRGVSAGEEGTQDGNGWHWAPGLSRRCAAGTCA